MSVRRILKLGDPLLRRRSVDVPLTELRSKEIKNLIRDLRDTMKDAGGIGLAAPQIGVLKRVVIVGFEKSERYPDQKGIEERVLINPEIEALEGPGEGFWEDAFRFQECEASSSGRAKSSYPFTIPTRTGMKRSSKALTPSCISMNAITSTACSMLIG